MQLPPRLRSQGCRCASFRNRLSSSLLHVALLLTGRKDEQGIGIQYANHSETLHDIPSIIQLHTSFSQRFYGQLHRTPSPNFIPFA
jgi:hypothetical protein